MKLGNSRGSVIISNKASFTLRRFRFTESLCWDDIALSLHKQHFFVRHGVKFLPVLSDLLGVLQRPILLPLGLLSSSIDVNATAEKQLSTTTQTQNCSVVTFKHEEKVYCSLISDPTLIGNSSSILFYLHSAKFTI